MKTLLVTLTVLFSCLLLLRWSCYELWRAFVGFKTGCRQGGAVSAASPLWGVSEPQRRRQPVFNPTRAGSISPVLGLPSDAELLLSG
jgi:hypothetical protein